MAIRFPKALWLAVRRAALDEGLSGLAWLSAAAEVALAVRASRQDGSVAEKNESAARRGSVAVDPDPFHELNETTTREVARGRAEDAARPVDRTKPITSPISYDRIDETRCGRCRVPWKNHQEGSRKNRAGTTGCTTFEDPS